MNKKKIVRGAKIELARRNFFYYCNLKSPDFYKKDRPFLVEICNELQSFIEQEEEEVLILNVPPRHRQVQDSV